MSMIALALVAFVSTNVDDFFLLTLWFLKRTSLRAVALGQTVGFTALLIVSALGYLGTTLLLGRYIHWLGLLPIAVGIKQLFSKHKDEDRPADNWWSVATLTAINGGDNIAVYVPLLSRHSRGGVGLIVLAFYLCLLLWVAAARIAARTLAKNGQIHRLAHRLSPFMIMLVGVVIFLSR